MRVALVLVQVLASVLASALGAVPTAAFAQQAQGNSDFRPSQDTYQEASRLQFSRAQFDLIEANYESLRKSGAPSNRGLPLSDTLADFDLLIQCGDQIETTDAACWKEFDGRAAEWAKRYPTSGLPRLAMARSFVRKAMWAQESKERLPEANQLFEEAQEIYEAIPKDRRDPIYYIERIDAAIEQGWEQKRFDQLVQEATDKFPYDANIYRRAANFYLPSRGGQLSGVEAFAKSAVTKSVRLSGTSMYAQIYDEIILGNYGIGHEAMGQTQINLASFNAGWVDLYRQHPETWNLNRFAQHACLDGDFTLLGPLLAKIGPTTKSVPGDGWILGDLDRCRALLASQQKP